MPSAINIKVKNIATVQLFIYVYDRSDGPRAPAVFADYIDPSNVSGWIEIEPDDGGKYVIQWLTQATDHDDAEGSTPVEADKTYDLTAGP
jgi:hypothetical protein